MWNFLLAIINVSREYPTTTRYDYDINDRQGWTPMTSQSHMAATESLKQEMFIKFSASILESSQWMRGSKLYDVKGLPFSEIRVIELQQKFKCTKKLALHKFMCSNSFG